ncbi:hypothetical protein ACFPJ1_10430 [Kribbella qitaiheensis]|uniref:hypothetical protein n=1 Tax=Kribbella qitaiheensis TaxID=1544730 RepID=UPI00360D2CE1
MRAHLLLQRAEEILDEKKSTPQRRPTQIAAFLIRQALEEAVAGHCERLITRLDHPVTMRSRLTVLHLFDQTGAAETAEYTWNALSRACHHHAYELAPTASELQHLLALVRQLVPPTTTDQPPGVST